MVGLVSKHALQTFSRMTLFAGFHTRPWIVLEEAAHRRAMFLRRRRRSPDSHAEALVDSIPPENGEEVRLVSVSKLKALTRRKSKRRTWLIFGLGGLFGIIVAAFFANQNDVINLEGLMDLNLDSLLDVIPAGIIKDAKELTVGSTAMYVRVGTTVLNLY